MSKKDSVVVQFGTIITHDGVDYTLNGVVPNYDHVDLIDDLICLLNSDGGVYVYDVGANNILLNGGLER